MGIGAVDSSTNGASATSETGEWDITALPDFRKKGADEIDWLWNATLPANRDTNPAVWDSITGFFEEAIVASCARPGNLVTTPRELLKQLKHNGREPASGKQVIDKLFTRGDIVSATSLQTSASYSSSSSSSSASRGLASSLRSTLTSYIWGAPKPTTPGLDDRVIATAALSAVAAKAEALAATGVTSSDSLHTVRSLATALTGGSTRDAEAVIQSMTARGTAAAVPGEDAAGIAGVRLGAGGEVSEAERGLLRTKNALERMQDMSVHLEGSVQAETERAVSAGRRGDKASALLAMKKKKALEAKLLSARSAASKLADVLMAVDETHSNNEAVSALETGMSSLKAVTESGGATADRIDDIAADFDEAMAGHQEVRSAFETLNIDAVGADAELEDDLERLLAAEEVGGLQGSHDEKESEKMAAALVAGAGKKMSQTAQAVDEAEAELERLMAELPMPASPAGQRNDAEQQESTTTATAAAAATTTAP